MPPPSDKRPVGRPNTKKNDAEKAFTPTKISKDSQLDMISEKGRTLRSQKQSASKVDSLSQQQERVPVQTNPIAADATINVSMDVDDGTHSEEESSEDSVE